MTSSPQPPRADGGPSRGLAVALALLALPLAGPWIGPSLGGVSAEVADDAETNRSHEPLFVSTYSLNTVEADKWRGGVWVGTGVGLLFATLEDGNASDPGGTVTYHGVRDGLGGSNVKSLAVTADRVYVATNVGVSVLDKASGTFSPVTYENGTALSDAVHAVAVVGGAAWVGSGREGMFRVDPSTLVAEPVANPHNGSRFDDAVMDFAFDGSEMFVSVNRYGVVRWDRETGETDRYEETARTNDPLYFNMALTSERVWVGTSYDGAIAYDRETGKSHHYSGGDTLKAINVFEVEAFGDDVWFTTDGGVARYDQSEEEWYNYQNRETGWPWGQAHDVEMIDGTVVALSRANQVARYLPLDDSFERVHWWTQDKVAPWDTMIGCTKHDGKLLFATGGHGSWFYDPEKGQWRNVQRTLGDPDSGPPEILHRDADGDEEALWIATDNGLGRFDRGSGSWSTHETFAESVHEQAANRVQDVDLTEDSVWAAAMTARYGHVPFWASGHLAQMDRETGEWTRWNTTDGLSGQNVTAVEPRGDRVYVGIQNAGIDVLDRSDGSVEHLYPDDSHGLEVYDLASRGGWVWAATTDGLVRVNTTSLSVDRPAAFDDTALYSLKLDGDVLWAGGVANGFHRWNLTTGERDSFTVPAGEDIWGYCTVEDDGLLYVGTQRGVDRFDPDRETFLPAYGHRSRWLDRSGEGQPSIAIDEPAPNATVADNGTLTVGGTASGVDDASASVEVRVPGSGWRPAEGVSSWSLSVQLDDAPTGPHSIPVRLVEDGETLAQAARTIQISAPHSEGNRQGSGPSPSIDHVPVLAQQQGEASRVEVTVNPVPEDLEGLLSVNAPSNDTSVERQLNVSADGTLMGRLPAFESAGMAEYQIEVRWADGRARLPPVDSAYGEAYALAVRPIEGVAAARLVHQGEVQVTPGESTEAEVRLQNTGTRSAAFDLAYRGPAFSWLDGAPNASSVEAGSSSTIPLEFSIPADAAAGKRTLTIEATPSGLGAGHGDALDIELSTRGEDAGVGSSEAGEVGGSNETGLGLGLVLGSVLATAASAALGRRR